tara:strand:+ start:32 stop:613 length:582 start_codon:yes stop_codon:yes gene_type:complete
LARTRREKKEEAKRRIDDAVPTLPVPRFAPAPVRGLNLVLRGAEALAQGLVEVDPLGIITEPSAAAPGARRNRPVQGPMTEEQFMMSLVNNPGFKLSADDIDLINNDDRMIVSNGTELMEINGRQAISRSGQFRRDKLMPGKRARRKTKTDKTMSKALAQANKELRKKNGQLRKGVSQADIMRRAHRIRRKMS